MSAAKQFKTEIHYQSFFRKLPMTKQQFMASRRLLWLAVVGQAKQATIAVTSIIGSKVSLLALAALTMAAAGVLNHRQHVENLSATVSAQAELRRNHAACDQIIFAIGKLMACGYDPIKALEAVQKSNDSKRLADGGFQFNEFGKVMKPSHFVEPDLSVAEVV